MLMIFHRSLTDTKSPQISRTHLSIQDDISIAVVWMVLTFPLISKSCSNFINILGIVPSAPFFNSLFIFLFDFNFILWSSETAKSTFRQILIFFFVDSHLVGSSGRELVIYFYLIIPENLVRPIIQDGFRVEHIYLLFHNYFTVDHLPHPVVSCLLLFLF